MSDSPDIAASRHRWPYYCVLMGRWYCQETGAYGFPAKGDWYVDAGEWRIW